MSAQYLSPEQDQRLRRWESWNRRYFIFAFIALTITLVFSSELGWSSTDSWGPLGIILVVLILPIIILQLRLKCPACDRKIGWQAKLMAPDQCPHCRTFLRSRQSA